MEYKTLSYGLFGLVAMVFWAMEYWKIFKKPELVFSSQRNKRKSFINFVRLIVFIIGIFGWLSVSYSLTRPRIPQSIAPQEIEVNDIFFVVDVSRSMLAEDFKTNRLEAAKKKIHEFIKLRPTDRIGIVIFSEKAFTLLPLTTDLSLIEQIISDIKVGYLGSGTNIGDALGLAVARANGSEAKKKVIILLTDGVNNVGNMTPIQAAEQAKELGVKVYTIGMGSDKNAKIPVPGGVFGTRYQLIPGGSIDTKTLNKISKMTNAKSYIAKDSKALKDVLSEIEKLERTKIKQSSQVIYDELFYRWLSLGIILLLISQVLRRLWLKEVV